MQSHSHKVLSGWLQPNVSLWFVVVLAVLFVICVTPLWPELMKRQRHGKLHTIGELAVHHCWGRRRMPA